MTEEYERIRELVEARIRTKLLIFRDATQLAYERKEYAPEVWGFAKEVATLILSANGIEIRADNQDLPEKPSPIPSEKLYDEFRPNGDCYWEMIRAFGLAQQDMLTPKDDCVWVKCKVKEEHNG